MFFWSRGVCLVSIKCIHNHKNTLPNDLELNLISNDHYTVFWILIFSTLKHPIFNGLSCCELYQEYTHTLLVIVQGIFVCWTKIVEMTITITVKRYGGIQNFEFSNSWHPHENDEKNSDHVSWAIYIRTVNVFPVCFSQRKCDSLLLQVCITRILSLV